MSEILSKLYYEKDGKDHVAFLRYDELAENPCKNDCAFGSVMFLDKEHSHLGNTENWTSVCSDDIEEKKQLFNKLKDDGAVVSFHYEYDSRGSTICSSLIENANGFIFADRKTLDEWGADKEAVEMGFVSQLKALENYYQGMTYCITTAELVKDGEVYSRDKTDILFDELVYCIGVETIGGISYTDIYDDTKILKQALEDNYGIAEKDMNERNDNGRTYN